MEFWRSVVPRPRVPADPEVAAVLPEILASPAVAMHRELLARLGRDIDTLPVVFKPLPGPHWRFFFAVRARDQALDVARGAVIALVLLHDPTRRLTLYAHPVHAGPDSNPLLRHIEGPMATPKAQGGAAGDAATRRFLEHKAAIWTRFEAEAEVLGIAEASSRWRESFYLALFRLYLCAGCSPCQLGDPLFGDGVGRLYRARDESPAPYLPPTELLPSVDRIRASDAWTIETRYALRGGFKVVPEPSLVARADPEWVFAVFPTDVERLRIGSLVGVATYLNESDGKVYAHALHFGPEPELLLRFGATALGLPRPAGAQPLAHDPGESYSRWRASAWQRFWLDELHEGIHTASLRWLAEHRRALAALLRVPEPMTAAAPAQR